MPWCFTKEVTQHNTFLSIQEPTAAQRARILRRHQTDADEPQGSHQPPLQQRRLNAEGDSVPGSQDSVMAQGLLDDSQDTRYGSQDSQMADLAGRGLASLCLQDDQRFPAAAPRAEGLLTENSTDAATASGSVTSAAQTSQTVLRCVWCPGSTFASAGALMRHMTRAHGGCQLDAQMLRAMESIDRAVCASPGCGCIRRRDSRQCHRCGETHATRALSAADVIPGARRGAVPTEDAGPEQCQAAGGAQPAVDGDVMLPPRFTERIRQLPSATLVHIPVACRARIAVVTAQCWEGTAAALPGWSRLEEARSKLLFAGIPARSHMPKEVASRLALLEAREFETLLERVEADCGPKRRRRRKRPAGEDLEPLQDDRAKRALRQTEEGAYRRAITTLSASQATSTAPQNLRWAHMLHPPAADGATALASPASAAVPPADDAGGSEDLPHPLKGIRVAALKAPGPSGTRAEHVSELLGVSRKRIATRLMASLQRLLRTIESGALCEEARWLVRTRTFFLEKKPGDFQLPDAVPRPIKVGEFLRAAASKRIAASGAAALRPLLLRMRQWGIGVPGGCEALVHWRSTIEQAARAGVIEPVVIADLDMKNFFNTVEWSAIREGIERHLKAAKPMVEWEQRQPGCTILPDGSEFTFNRGAEQGEPLGSLKATLPLGGAAMRTPERLGPATRATDEWLIDDGQLVCSPDTLEPWLQAFDAEIAPFGASRGSGPDVKSVARIVCPASRVDEFRDWAPQYVRATCRILEPNAPTKVLGAVHGSDQDIVDAFLAVCAKVEKKREAIAFLGNPAAELVLTRRCGHSGNASYALRCNGDKLLHAVAERFDPAMRIALEDILGGPLPDTAWMQASTGVSIGGLGLRTATSTALPAFLSSRSQARPLVRNMFERLQQRGLGSASDLMALYDARTDSAAAAFLQMLPGHAADEARTAFAEEAAASEARWLSAVAPASGGKQYAPGDEGDDGADSLRQIGSLAPGLVLDAGAEDDEHPGYPQRGASLQRRLQRLVDAQVGETLVQHFSDAGDRLAVARLGDLAHKDTSHAWLWSICASHGPVIEEAREFVEAVRVRIGSCGPIDGGVCGYCGRVMLDASGGHCSCCAAGESTRGHNAIRDTLFDVSAAADDRAEKEPDDLVPSRPGLRLVDVLSFAAIPGRVAALDVGVASPYSEGAGADAAASMYARKTGEREDIRDELAALNTVYKPMVWTTYGRPHAAAIDVLRRTAQRLSRRRGWGSQKAVLTQIHTAVSVALARRAARMSLACWPKVADGKQFDFEASQNFLFDPGDF